MFNHIFHRHMLNDVAVLSTLLSQDGSSFPLEMRLMLKVLVEKMELEWNYIFIKPLHYIF